MKKLLTRLCLAVTMFAAPLASAEADAFGLGTGRDGALKVEGTLRINPSTALAAPLAPGDQTLRVASTADFSAGDLVMVVQSTGLVPEMSSGRVAPLNLGQDPVGTFELARVADRKQDTLVLTAPLLHGYAASVTQVVRVPEYTRVDVAASGVIEAEPWNGHTGGIVAFLAQQTVNHHGRIDASGKGFRGGAANNDGDDTLGCTDLDERAPLGAKKGEGVSSTRFGATGRGNAANAGGGGVCLMSGGGGGGHGGTGGQGGRSINEWDLARGVGGQGGVKLDYDMRSHLSFGGGGGAGHVGITWLLNDGSGDGSGGQGHTDHGNGNGYGHCKGRGKGHDEDECTRIPGKAGDAGSGGGILFIRAAELAGQGRLVANGASGGDGVTSGGSGGGAGGLISARFTGAASCGAVQAEGGAGGSADATPSYSGPGGGGGGGVILFQARSISCPASVKGGNAGTSVNNSVDASNGAVRAEDGILKVIIDEPTVPQPQPEKPHPPSVPEPNPEQTPEPIPQPCGDNSLTRCVPPVPNPEYDSLFQGGGAGCSTTSGTAPLASLLLLVMTAVGARKR